MTALLESAWRFAATLGGRAALNAVYGCEPLILMYHRFSAEPAPRRVSVAAFERQMSYLARHANVVTMQELTAGLRSGISWQPDTVSITIDDGYADLHDLAFPVLRKYGLPAMAFITSDFARGALWHWPDQLHHILMNCAAPALRVETGSGALELALSTAAQRLASWNLLADYCHELHEAAREEEIAAVSRLARVPVPARAPPEYRGVDFHQLRSMIAGGLSVGGHSVTHARLPTLTDPELSMEIEGCKKTLEQQLQVAVSSFAYPFGAPGDHDERIHGAVLRAGFDNASVSYFDAHLYDDIYALRRFGVSGDFWDFIKVVGGLKRARAKQREHARRPNSRVRT
ncbi:MAG TPA: polysaccharide deacetylase family protein [Steroidobacteraceae bacterium]|nr:polysaccharide deacetylase family protein [Steroidobacteraceae bacterium]